MGHSCFDQAPTTSFPPTSAATILFGHKGVLSLGGRLPVKLPSSECHGCRALEIPRLGFANEVAIWFEFIQNCSYIEQDLRALSLVSPFRDSSRPTIYVAEMAVLLLNSSLMSCRSVDF
jgi:hypothetical protein